MRLLVWILLAFSFGAGAVVGWVLLTRGSPSDRQPPTTSRTWPDLDLAIFPIRLSLKTEWREGVRYQFRVFQQGQSQYTDYDDVVDLILGPPGSSHPDIFTLHFLSETDFELCNAEIGQDDLTLDRSSPGPDIVAHGAASECSLTEYLDARKWTVSYRQTNVVSGAKVRAEPSEGIERQ
jgi:hypothetical protein